MKAILILAFFVTILFIHSNTSQQLDDKNEILQWYYNLNQENTNLQREKRQSGRSGSNFDYNNDENDDDEWYVFDEVEPQSQPQPPPQNNDNQFGWNARLQQESGSFQGSVQQFRPNTIPSTTQRPAFPNAGPPRPSICAENCFSATTSEYNPVCGSNGVTYNNLAKLKCAVSCGISVQVQREGRCAPLLPPAPQPVV